MIIENFNELAATPLRKQALIIADCGLEAIETKKLQSPLSQISGSLVFVHGDNTILKAMQLAGANTEEVQIVVTHLPNALEFGKFSLVVNETKPTPATSMYQAGEILSKYKILETTGLTSAGLVNESTESLPIEMVSLNKITLTMKQKAEDLGWPVSIQNQTNHSPKTMLTNARQGYCTINMNPSLENLDIALKVLPYLNKNQVFLAINSIFVNDAAGGIVDSQTLENSRKLYLNPDDYLANNDSYHFLESTGGLIFADSVNTNLLGFSVCLKEKT